MKKIKDTLLGIAGFVVLGAFTCAGIKSHYEPHYPEAIIQYKASTFTPIYSGFDKNKDGKIDSINVFRARWLGYQNYDLVEGDPEFSEKKDVLEKQLALR